MENKVWYYRNERNLTLKQLSKLTGISVGELSNIENILFSLWKYSIMELS